jgi:Secretion system C-terminal sorting domain
MSIYGQSNKYNDLCQKALSLMNGQIVEDTLTFLSISTIPSCESAGNKISRGLWYRFEGNDRIVKIILENKYLYTTKIKLFEGECGNLICSGKNINKFIAKSNVQYYVLVESENWYSLNEAPYKLTFTEFDIDPLTSCNSAPILNCNQNYIFDFENKLLPSELPGCNTFGPVGFFRLLGDGQTREFNFTSADLSGYYLLFFETDNCVKAACIGIRYLEPKMIFSTTPGKSYLLAMVKYFEFSAPEISFSMTCMSDVNSKNCQTATNLVCGAQYTSKPSSIAYPEVNNIYSLSSWYKIIGNGKQNKLIFTRQPACGIHVYKSNSGCTELINYLTKDPSSQYNSLIIDAEINTDYYIEITHQSVEEIRFNVSCNDSIKSNFSCIAARDISCGQKIQIYNFSNLEPNSQENKGIGQWYRFVGNDSIYRLSNLNPSTNLYEMTIFREGCDSLQFIANNSLPGTYDTQGNLYLKIKKEDVYLIRFNLNNYFFNSFDLQVSCLPSSEYNSICVNADSLYCNKEVNFNKIQIFDINEEYCNFTKGTWFKLRGTGDIFSIPLEGIYGRCDIYEGTCNNITCLFSINTGFSDINFKTELEKDYLIKVSYDYLPFGIPNREIKCISSDINDECSNALPVDCETNNLFLNFGETSFNQNNDSPCVNPGGRLWYKIEGNNRMFQFNKDNISADIKMISFKADGCGNLVCMDDEVSDYLKFYAEVGYTYFVLFTASEFSNGHTVRILCKDLEENSTCSRAYDIQCDMEFVFDFGSVPFDSNTTGVSQTDLWYRYHGNDSLVTFSKIDSSDLYYGYQIFINNCDSLFASNFVDSLNFQFYRNSFSFYAQRDQIYYIRLVSNFNNKHKFKTTCKSIISGDICQTAKTIDCGDSYTLNTSDYTPDYLGINMTVFNGAWFMFEGNDTYLEMDKSTFFNVLAFESDSSCTQLNEIVNKSYNGSSIGFFAKKNKLYYFLVGTTYLESPDISGTISFQCIDADMNKPTCPEAKIINCGDRINSNNFKEILTPFGNCTPENSGDWFKFVGDGNVWTIFMTANKYSLGSFQAYIGSGSCNTLACVKAFDIRNGWLSSENRNSFSFKTTADTTYFLKLASYENSPYDLDLSVLCTPVSTNVDCSAKLIVNCDDEWKGIINQSLVQESDNPCTDTNSGHYYQITGTGGYFIMTLDKYSGSKALEVSIIENSCENGRCLYQGMMDLEMSKSLLFEAKANRKYIIKVSGTQNDIVYRIKTKCEPIPDNISCENAAYLDCSTTFDLNLQTPMGYNGDVPCYNTLSTAFWYFLPKTDSLFEVEIVERTNESIYVELIKGSCNSLTCVQSLTNNNQRLAFSTDSDDDYYLVIHGNTNTVNHLKLKLNCVDRPSNDFCSSAIPIICGDTISGGTYLATVSPMETNCFLSQQKDVWYSFVSSGEKNSFLISNVKARLNVNIYEANNCDSTLICKSVLEIGFSEIGSTINFAGETGIEYLMQIQNYYIESSLFTIRRLCSVAVPNDLCNGATPLNELNNINFANSTGESFQQLGICSQKSDFGIWYSIEGNDSIAHINGDIDNNSYLYYSLFSGDCNSLKCISNGQLYNPEILKFRADKGKKYYLLLYKQYQIQPETYLIRLRFVPPGHNDYCTGAKEIYCGDNIEVNSDYYSKDSLSRCLEDKSSAWFKINGADEKDKVFKMSYDFKNIDFAVEIFENCDTFCAFSQYFYKDNLNSLEFIAQKDKYYFARINFGEKLDSADIKITTSCKDLDFQNISKEMAIPLECKNYFIDAKKMIKQIDFSCFPYFKRQLYYKFIGDGSIFKIKRMFNPYAEIFITHGDECKVIDGIGYSGGEFITENGLEYFLVIAISDIQYQEQFSFDIEFKCTSNSDDVAKKGVRIEIVPNPFFENTEIKITSNKDQFAMIKIIDLTGKPIWVKKHFLTSENPNNVELNELTSLPSGVYKIQLITNDAYYEHKIIKIR